MRNSLKRALVQWLGNLPNMRKAYQTDLSDAKWSRLKAHLPTTPKTTRRPRVHDLREILDVVLHIVRSSCGSCPTTSRPGRLCLPLLQEMALREGTWERA